MAQLVGRHPADQRSLVGWDAGPVPRWGSYGRQSIDVPLFVDVSLLLSPSPPLSLKLKKKKGKKERQR